MATPKLILVNTPNFSRGWLCSKVGVALEGESNANIAITSVEWLIDLEFKLRSEMSTVPLSPISLDEATMENNAKYSDPWLSLAHKLRRYKVVATTSNTSANGNDANLIYLGSPRTRSTTGFLNRRDGFPRQGSPALTPSRLYLLYFIN